jgi:protocatechuate 3,4-dioxygenase beta subunit
LEGLLRSAGIAQWAVHVTNAMFEGMPSQFSWATSIAPAGEPGEPMIISGTIYQKDGVTPAQGIMLYVYHTDNAGIYSPAPDQTVAIRHGHLRGWMKTDARGRYQFKSIRPGTYPNRGAPAHVHPLIKETGLTRYYIDEFRFEDDPLLTADERANQEKRGGGGIIALKKNAQGVWVGQRDIILGMNIPGY